MLKYYMFNKPQGCITDRTDPRRKTVMEYFPQELRKKLHPVGRLDKDTEGLLIFTDDGSLDNRLMQPGNHVAKEYFFRAVGDLNGEDIAALEKGVRLYGDDYPPSKPAEIEVLTRETIKNRADLLPEYRRARYLKNPEGPVISGLVRITEGKKHQVKLMLKYSHCSIFYLKRTAVGMLRLDESLSPGEYRELSEKEILMLTRLDT